MTARALTALLFVGLVACGGDDDGGFGALSPGFESTLVHTGGCGDVYVYAADDEDRVALSLRVPDLVAEAVAAGETTESTVYLTAADDGISVNVTTGQNVTADYCTDVVIEEPIITSHWISTEGTAVITVTPGATADQSRASLVLDEVHLEPIASPDRPVTIHHFEMDDVSVGWFPG